MDAKVGDWVVTPRIGKSMKVNAPWCNALQSPESFTEALSETAEPFAERADQVAGHFGRFWAPEREYLRDVIDEPDGDDSSLRPNQIFAVSLPHSPLAPLRQEAYPQSTVWSWLLGPFVKVPLRVHDDPE